jgi:integrase
LRKSKNGEIRRVPSIAEMGGLLERLRQVHPDEPAISRVMRAAQCELAMKTAVKKAGIAHLTHHDLRHLFATPCVESGVDIPTVSRWLGHKDRGALAMKVYGHLRNQRSASMAKLVNFAPSNPNIIQLPNSEPPHEQANRRH